MKVNILKLNVSDHPDVLGVILPPPKQLFWLGASFDEILARPRVAIVGSRKATNYGRIITQDLANKLAREGAVIISGLAFGVDSYSHKAALDGGGLTVAVLPSPLQQIYPASHYQLAEQILRSGGALVSEYPEGTEVREYSFIARNRIISALADVLVIPEAAKNSGSLHTARFALEQGKTVMAVPGNVNSPLSEGCNNLIKSGAAPVTSVEDIFFALKIKPKDAKVAKIFQGTPQQQLVFDLITQGVQDQEELAMAAHLPVPEISSTLTSLELSGYIRPLGAGSWTIS